MLASLFGVACNDRRAAAIPESEEPLYANAVTLKNQERYGEALTSYLRLIDKRGEQGAAESHLDAGTIYLNHIKDPVLAYYHFKRYLELNANSKEAPRVKGMLEASLRGIAARFPAGFSAENQSNRNASAEDLVRLRRENDELRAENQTLRGSNIANRRPPPIVLPDSALANPPPAPPPVQIGDATPAPQTTRQAGMTPSTSRQVPLQPAQKATTTSQTVRQPTVPPASTNQRTAATPSGRTHTVKPKETLYAISRQYNVKLEDLQRANGISNSSSVRVGTVLKIP
ncbi:MAG: LysM peptidoglycan-binding domain-containing protein [Verrucomicrobiota bacterium]